jgi:hypothetical protein
VRSTNEVASRALVGNTFRTFGLFRQLVHPFDNSPVVGKSSKLLVPMIILPWTMLSVPNYSGTFSKGQARLEYYPVLLICWFRHCQHQILKDLQALGGIITWHASPATEGTVERDGERVLLNSSREGG